jgi:peptidoglycan hydrolase-like protein with peptidoglycan-binding domain
MFDDELRPGHAASPSSAPGTVGRSTLTSRLAPRLASATAAPVQRQARADAEPASRDASAAPAVDPFALHLIADQGVQGAGAPLPYLDELRPSFGRHAGALDGARAHVGGAAAEAAGAIGAQAYATGGQVAFASPPDRALVGHEAAHLVQQQGGVQLKGGVGAAGDAYERQADAVGAAFAAGGSVEGLLDERPAAAAATGAAIQRQDAGAPAPAPAPRPRLAPGAKGPAVTALQEALRRAGDPLVADADFGGTTRDAVIAFQRRAQLPPTGIVDDATWAALDAAAPMALVSAPAADPRDQFAGAADRGAKNDKDGWVKYGDSHGWDVGSRYGVAPTGGADNAAILAVSRVEGSYDNVQTYDSGILSFGIMQWTFHEGSLQRMLGFLKDQSGADGKAAFAEHFTSVGIDVVKAGEYKLSYLGTVYEHDTKDKSQLEALLRANKETARRWVDTFGAAGQDPRVQKAEYECARTQYHDAQATRLSDEVVDRARQNCPETFFAKYRGWYFSVETMTAQSPRAAVVYFSMADNNPSYAQTAFLKALDAFYDANGTDRTKWAAGWPDRFADLLEAKSRETLDSWDHDYQGNQAEGRVGKTLAYWHEAQGDHAQAPAPTPTPAPAPAPPAPAPAQVQPDGDDADAYNRAHHTEVVAFNIATSGVCTDGMGGVVASKVRAWQNAHELDVDGKVGPQTLGAANNEARRTLFAGVDPPAVGPKGPPAQQEAPAKHDAPPPAKHDEPAPTPRVTPETLDVIVAARATGDPRAVELADRVAALVEKARTAHRGNMNEEQGDDRRALIDGERELRPAIAALAGTGLPAATVASLQAGFYRVLADLSPYYHQMNKGGILDDHKTAVGFTCNITSLSMTLENLGKSSGDYDSGHLPFVQAAAKRFSGGGDPLTFRLPDFMQLAAIAELMSGPTQQAAGAARDTARQRILDSDFLIMLAHRFGVGSAARKDFHNDVLGRVSHDRRVEVMSRASANRQDAKHNAAMSQQELASGGLERDLPIAHYRDGLLGEVGGEIDSGAAIIVAVAQHYVRLQALHEDHVVIDDPGSWDNHDLRLSYEELRAMGGFQFRIVIR